MANHGTGYADGGGISFSFPVGAFNGASDINGGFNFDLPMATIQSFQSQAYSFAKGNSENAFGFLQNVIDTSQSNVNQTAGRAFEYQSQGLNVMQSISESMRSTINSSISKRAAVAIFQGIGNMAVRLPARTGV